MRYFLTFMTSISGFFITSPALAETCFIADPTDTALNVRATPNGEIINRLRNGREVEIELYQDDAKGRSWGYATGEYKGKHRKWGWVFMEAVDCQHKVTASSSTNVSIVTRKILPAPGKIRVKSSSNDKAFRKALTKPRKLPKHSSPFISNGQIDLFMPALDWGTGVISLINFTVGFFVTCDGKIAGCFQISRSGTDHYDNTPLNWHNANSSAPLAKVGDILRKKKIIGASFVHPEFPNSTIKINSDFSVEYFSNGQRILVGGWFQNDNQLNQSTDRWKQMHKKMRRYSGSAKDERKRKIGRLLGTIAKVGIAAARAKNGGSIAENSKSKSNSSNEGLVCDKVLDAGNC